MVCVKLRDLVRLGYKGNGLGDVIFGILFAYNNEMKPVFA